MHQKVCYKNLCMARMCCSTLTIKNADAEAKGVKLCWTAFHIKSDLTDADGSRTDGPRRAEVHKKTRALTSCHKTWNGTEKRNTETQNKRENSEITELWHGRRRRVYLDIHFGRYLGDMGAHSYVRAYMLIRSQVKRELTPSGEIKKRSQRRRLPDILGWVSAAVWEMSYYWARRIYQRQTEYRGGEQ